jgi:hypothetical protein
VVKYDQTTSVDKLKCLCCLNKVDKKLAVKAIPKHKLIGVTIEDRSDTMPSCPCYACIGEEVSEINFDVKTSGAGEGAKAVANGALKGGAVCGCFPPGLAGAFAGSLGLDEDESSVKIVTKKGSVDEQLVLGYVYGALSKANNSVHMVSHLQSDDMMKKMSMDGRRLIAATTAAESMSAPAMDSNPFDQTSKFDLGSMMYRLDSEGDKGCDWCLCIPTAKKATSANIEFFEGMVLTKLGTTSDKRIVGIAVGAIGGCAIVTSIMAVGYGASQTGGQGCFLTP